MFQRYNTKISHGGYVEEELGSGAWDGKRGIVPIKKKHVFSGLCDLGYSPLSMLDFVPWLLALQRRLVDFARLGWLLSQYFPKEPKSQRLQKLCGYFVGFQKLTRKLFHLTKALLRSGIIDGCGSLTIMPHSP